MAFSRRLITGMLIIAAALSGCGKKGPLIPPEGLVPAPIANLALAQKGSAVQVSWSAPGKQEGGGRLQDLGGFLLFRRAVLPPAEDCEDCAGAYRQLARIDLEYPQGARRAGSLWIYDDHDLKQGAVFQYKVRSFTGQGVLSKDSNKARRAVHTPPFPPVLETVPSTEAVMLNFVALPPEEGSLTGYNVYRARKGGELPLTPLNKVPVTGNSYRDDGAVPGVSYDYAVTSVAAVGEVTVESARSNLVSAALQEPD